MTGRPVKWKSAKDMQKAIDEYFLECETKDKPKTITGLAMALDLTRQGLCEYAAKALFSDTVKKAKEIVVAEVEERLFSSNCTGSIFWLKNNAGWKDAQTIQGDKDNPVHHEIIVKHVKPNP